MTDPVLMVALPMLASFLLPVVYRRNLAIGRALGPLALVLAVVVGLGVWQAVRDQGPFAVAMGNFAAPVGIVFYVDGLALLFALAMCLAALLLWPNEPRDPVRESTLTLLLTGAACGLALSGDLFNIFVFYEVMAVASYGLAASRATAGGYGASLRFLILSALGSSMALLGIAIVYALTGTLNLAHLSQLAPQLLNGPPGLAAFTLMLFGFGVKAELFPVNTWVPEVYGNAPVRVSGLLAGVTSKLALLVILRLLLLIFANTAAPLVLLTLGLLSALSGELAALRATELRRILSYSSIGQLGLVAIAFSVPGAAGIVAGLALALHHLVVKPALFLLTDAWGGAVKHLAGGARTSRLGAGLFLLLALSLIGVPPLPGFWAKFLLLRAVLEVDHGLYWTAAAVVLAVTVIEAAYLFRVVRELYRSQRPHVVAPAHCEMVPALGLGTVLVLGTLLIAPLGSGLTQIAEQAADRARYVQTVLPPKASVPSPSSALKPSHDPA